MTEPSNKGAKRPLLAKKGTAQPLMPPAEAKREEAPSEDPGLDPKPPQEPPVPEETKADESVGDTPPAKPPAAPSPEPAAAAEHSNGGSADPEQPEQLEATGEDDDTARPGPESAKQAAPVATMLDHPMRLPKTILFEDEPKGAKTPAQGTAVTASGDTPESEDAEATPGGTQGEVRRRRADLAAWVKEGRRSERSERKHWPLAVGALVCAIALIALVESGIIPPGDEEGEPQQPAEQTQASPSPERAAAEVHSEDVPVAPAGAAGEESQAPDVSAAQSETEPAVPGEAPALAVLPDPQAIADLERDPVVDFIRLDPAGKAVVAGRAAPGTELVILDNGAQLGRATADIYGLWTFISDAPLSPGRHEIALALESQGTLTILPGPAPAVATPEPQRPAEPAEEADIEVAAGPAVTAPSPDESAAAPPTEPAPEAAAAPAPAVPQAPAATVAEAQTPSEPAEAATAAPSPAEMPEESTAAAATPVMDVPPQPVPKPERAAAPQVAAVAPASGSFAVQLASLTTPNAAQRAQGDLEKRFPDLLAGLEMFIDRATLADGRVVYRVRTGPFGSRADAAASCARFKTREQDCLVVRR